MDRKAILVLVLSFLLLLLWGPLVNRLFPPQPLPPGATNVVGAATNLIATSAAPATVATPVTPTPAAPAAIPLSAPEELLVLENAEARYTFTSHRGGLKLVELLRYSETVPCRVDKANGSTNPATLNRAPMPALALLGGEAIEGDGLFRLTRSGPGSVLAQKDLANGLRLTKEFTLGSNYVLTARVRLENRSAGPVQLPLRELVLGTATPMGPRDNTAAMLLGFYAYNGRKTEEMTEAWFENRTMGCFRGTPRTEYVSHPDQFVWAAVHNQFFAMVVMPDEPAPQVISHRIDLPRPDAEAVKADRRILARPYGYQTAFLYPPAVIEPGQAVERAFEIFAGPKEYKTLSRLGHKRELVMGFGFFGFFAKALLLAMNGLHTLFGGALGYGWVIIIITVIIKLLFWPLTNASTKSMKRMAALQPQMKALQEKYKDDPQKMNQKLMEFMKEHRVSPLGGCLPMVLQIPVFIGFFTMLRTAIELRGARFLWNLDLSSPDTVWVVPGLHFPINLLPLLMGVTMLWQAHMTPPSPGMDPVQQKIMKYMPLIFLVFLYNFSAGLTLYWTVQNLLTILQMKLTRSVEPAATAPGAPGRAVAQAPRVPLTSPKKRK